MVALSSTTLNCVPVEILVILHTISVMILIPVQSYYVIDKTAKQHNQVHILKDSESACHVSNATNINHINDSSVIIQKKAAENLMHLSLCVTIVSVIPIFLFGYLSDVYGRRQMWTVCACGTLAKEIILLLTVVLELPTWVLYFGQVIFALTGTYSGAMVIIFGSIADTTNEGKDRSFRITVVQGTGMLTAAVTTFGMGFWILEETFRYPIIMTLFLTTINLVLGLLMLPQKKQPATKLKTVLAPFKIYIDANSERRRKMFLCLAVFLLLSSCLVGKLGYQKLFLMRNPLCWNVLHVQILRAVQTLFNTIFVIGIVRLLLRITSESIILIVGIVSTVSYLIVFGFSINDLMVYSHVIVGCMSIAVFPMLRATLSKLVSSDEQGSVFASMACLDELVAAFAHLTYGKLYTFSVARFPGLIFLVMAGVSIITLFGAIVLHGWMHKDPKDTKESVIELSYIKSSSFSRDTTETGNAI
ncbi:SLC46A3 [Mytilus coruscus]|uniref:SLC46A3 n=1 Tax=Mytilus coruscus TaxID=42192 RepID=A0A6J8DCD6_MYTCO|nr:SLC46A3 [Mytilus coruscus]